MLYICSPVKNDLVAQPVEQLTLNQWVESSILSQVTNNQPFTTHICKWLFSSHTFLTQFRKKNISKG
jgi:hypothetical protein